MPVRSFDNANAFHRVMRRFIATKVGVTVFRPTAHQPGFSLNDHEPSAHGAVAPVGGDARDPLVGRSTQSP
jgi:hypothetical protein